MANNNNQIEYIECHRTTGPSPINDKCAICLSDITQTDPTILHTPCSNCWHTDCLDTWARESQTGNCNRRATCPLCRTAITPRVPLPPPVDWADALRQESLGRWLRQQEEWRQEVPWLRDSHYVTEATNQRRSRAQIGEWIILRNRAELERRVGADTMLMNPTGQRFEYFIHQPRRFTFPAKQLRQVHGLSVGGARSWTRFRFPHSEKNYLVPGPKLGPEELRSARQARTPPIRNYTFRLIDNLDELWAMWCRASNAKGTFTATAHFPWAVATGEQLGQWEPGHWDRLNQRRDPTPYHARHILGSPFIYFIPFLPTPGDNLVPRIHGLPGR